MTDKVIPFGMLFEEQKQSQQSYQPPRYDYEQGISLVETDEVPTPFVEWEWSVFAETSTGTSTKDWADPEDTDDDLARIVRNPRPETPENDPEKTGNTPRPRTHTYTENREETD